MNPYDPENKMGERLETAYPMTYMEDMAYDEKEDCIDFEQYDERGVLLNTPEKIIAHFERQIDELSKFILANYDDKICGSAVETAIHVMRVQAQKIRRLERVQADYARELLNKADNNMHQPVHHEAKSSKPHPAAGKKINLIGEKAKRFKKSFGGGVEGENPSAEPRPDDAFDRAREVV